MPRKRTRSEELGRLRPCLRCGYSLRAVMGSTRCPECGLAVWISLNPNNGLNVSSPAWLRRLSRGSAILAAASLAWALLQAVWIAQCFSYEMYISVYSPYVHLWCVTPVIWLLLIAGTAFFFKAEGRWPDNSDGTRIGTMFGSAFVLVGALVSVLVALSTNSWKVMWYSQVLSALLFDVVVVSALIHIHKRLARGRSMAVTRWVQRAIYLILFDIVVAFIWATNVTTQLPLPFSERILFAPGGVFILILAGHALLALLVAVAFTLAAFRFASERRDALAAWAAEEHPSQ